MELENKIETIVNKLKHKPNKISWGRRCEDDRCCLHYYLNDKEVNVNIYLDTANPRKKGYMTIWYGIHIQTCGLFKYDKIPFIIDSEIKKYISAKKGSSNVKPFSNFQIRWGEKLGNQDCPYLKRWTFIFFGYSIRIHHWLKSDDKRYFHDHSSDLISVVLKGKYRNVKPIDESKNPDDYIVQDGVVTKNICPYSVEGIFNSFSNFFNLKYSIWKSKATEKHYLEIPKEGAWTLLLEGKPYHKWGFYVNGKKLRPYEYFHKFGIIQDKKYQ